MLVYLYVKDFGSYFLTHGTYVRTTYVTLYLLLQIRRWRSWSQADWSASLINASVTNLHFFEVGWLLTWLNVSF